ncbi:hypothetical protein Misp01_14020 [Microtetraspora sp. NBRC 13810]|uniref:hypothetical protein n=1 Tax=Microtetraspora sp. NBRC 13810 TaxID=3030990 RepID=UPI0024A438D8|nr:hypothetical protein [Microtetraspora sp. NBRC 13810]GLW06272.1 hypothetical protein Misp01_14020 [Microtetraspora sp. NBRC 13810]
MRRTTFRLDETLLSEAKAFAAEHGRSLNSVMEDALRQLLNRAIQADHRPIVVLPTAGHRADAPAAHFSTEVIKELIDVEECSGYEEVRDATARR